MKTALEIGVVTTTLLMMLAVGLDLPGRHLREALGRGRLLAVVLALQWLLLPALGWAVAWMLDLPPHLAAALLLVAACPVGDIVNFYTLLARGNVAVSVALNALSCLLAPVSMAITLAVFRALGRDDGLFAVPTLPLVLRLLALTLLPVAAGSLLRRRWPGLARRLAVPVQTATGACLLALIGLILFAQWRQIAADWLPTAGAAVVFMAAGFGLGLAVAKLVAPDPQSAPAIALAFPLRNIGLAGTVAVTMLGRPDYAAFAVVYFLVEVPMAAFAALALRRRTSAGAPV
jgi:BASS family bile acid:Na+ symporter